MVTKEKKERKKVRIESADTACGGVPHMTVDEIAERLNIKGRELRCPACGKIHLTEEDKKRAEQMKYSETNRFKKIKQEAEAES